MESTDVSSGLRSFLSGLQAFVELTLCSLSSHLISLRSITRFLSSHAMDFVYQYFLHHILAAARSIIKINIVVHSLSQQQKIEDYFCRTIGKQRAVQGNQ
jgi:hypothetical protein